MGIIFLLFYLKPFFSSSYNKKCKLLGEQKCPLWPRTFAKKQKRMLKRFLRQVLSIFYLFFIKKQGANFLKLFYFKKEPNNFHSICAT
ncbi:unnamed protein product [Meloidogyne enterolobii]|uniref:Uncharacterized protein n=1 Tax=Meloidogyne enterolobii TaxID=390850 RepID=A0ACB0XU66_MELEN